MEDRRANAHKHQTYRQQPTNKTCNKSFHACWNAGRVSVYSHVAFEGRSRWEASGSERELRRHHTTHETREPPYTSQHRHEHVWIASVVVLLCGWVPAAREGRRMRKREKLSGVRVECLSESTRTRKTRAAKQRHMKWSEEASALMTCVAEHSDSPLVCSTRCPPVVRTPQADSATGDDAAEGSAHEPHSHTMVESRRGGSAASTVAAAGPTVSFRRDPALADAALLTNRSPPLPPVAFHRWRNEDHHHAAGMRHGTAGSQRRRRAAGLRPAGAG